MSRTLRRAAALLLLAAPAACTRSCSSSPGAETVPETARAAATRVAPTAAAHAIRPRPAPCVAGAEPSLGALVAGARGALDAGQKEHALDCAVEAVRRAPRSVEALAARADALSALERLPEAQLAYARALAVDPENPVALYGAADLYVRRLAGERDALETGLEYALRGARAALRPPRRDRELAGELQLLAGIAENDLGRNREALAHLDRAQAVLAEDADVAYERGVALFELCRFREAQRSFDRTLALAPDDPAAIHELGLVAEQQGDLPRAAQLLDRARTLDPKSFAPDLPVDAAAFDAQVKKTLAALSPGDRATLEGIPIELRDLPDTADLLAVDPPLSPAILGLFRGPPLGEACEPQDGPVCRSIVFYRKNLVRFAKTRAELDEQIRVTLLHEMGHLRGENDDELRDRGLE
jgi:Flp pilus assembly protein TadD/predicted Zn-dependent protease with MMP-like domain